MADISAINLQTIEARRLVGYRFELDIQFRQDGEPWDVSELPLRIAVHDSRGELVNTWGPQHYTRPTSDGIRLDFKTPAVAGLTTQMYECIVYTDGGVGKEPILLFNLYIDPSIRASPTAYKTGGLKAEAMVLNVVSDIPGATVEVQAAFELRLSALEQRVSSIESVSGGSVETTIEDIEAKAFGPIPKLFYLVQDGFNQPVSYAPGAGLVYLMAMPAGGPPEFPSGPTLTQRVAELELLLKSAYIRVYADSFDAGGTKATELATGGQPLIIVVRNDETNDGKQTRYYYEANGDPLQIDL